MSSITIMNDAPNCGITYDHHSDDSRGIICDLNMFIVQATDLTTDLTAEFMPWASPPLVPRS